MSKLTVFTYFWHLEEDDESTPMRVYALDENNETVCLHINDFTPYVYLELPDTIEWNTARAQLVGNNIDELLGRHRPAGKSLMWRRRLYGVHEKENGAPMLFPYLFCRFWSVNDIKMLRYKVNRPMYIPQIGRVSLKIHEDNADPILQLTCCRNLYTAGNMEFVGMELTGEDKMTLASREFVVKWKNTKCVDVNTVGNPLILAFDIEANSVNPSKMPDPKKPGDKVFQISSVFHRYGSPKSEYDTYLLTLGDPLQDIVGQNVNILRYETEADLLCGWVDLIREKNPNVLVGYNILGFDIQYMIKRAEHTLCIDKFSRLGFHKTAHARKKIIKWSSSAYKDQEFEYLDAEGRLIVDLQPLVQRDFKLNNYKLKTVATYFFGPENTKDPLSVKGIFKCYKAGVRKNENGTYGKYAQKAMGVVGKYCVQDTVLCADMMTHMRTWVGLSEMAKTCRVPMFTLYTQGQQVKVFSQVYHYCMYNNLITERNGYVTKSDERYVGAHVFPPVPGMYDKVVPFDFASLYPTTIIAYNIDYSTLVTDSSYPDEKCHVMEWEDHIGCPHDPKVIRINALTDIIDKEKAKVATLREKRNRTIDKFRRAEIADKISAALESIKPYMKERSELKKSKPKHIMCAHRKYRFKKEPKGVLPNILQNLLGARKNTRTEIKNLESQIETVKKSDMSDEDKDLEIRRLESVITVLDKRQLAYKVSANSMYGAMGVQKSNYLPFMPGAMCTTYMGRKSIEMVADIIPKKYGGKLVYGDTDSNYINFPHINSASEAWDYSIKVADEISALFPPPMKLEFEKVVYWQFFILTKKRYMYKGCKRDGNVDQRIGKKGVLLARRDNSAFIRNIYETVVDKIFDKESQDDVLYYITQELNKLCSGMLPISDFVITKAVSSNGGLVPEPGTNDKGQPCMKLGSYNVKPLSTKPETRIEQIKRKGAVDETDYYLKSLPSHVQLAEKMRRRGQRVDNGTRLEFVITTVGGHNAKQSVKIESAEYFASHSDVLNIDALKYINLLINPLDQVLNVAYGNNKEGKYSFVHDFVQEQYNIRAKKREKVMNQLKGLFKPKLVFKE